MKIKKKLQRNCEEQEGIEVVQVIGNTLILYKESKEKKRIELP